MTRFALSLALAAGIVLLLSAATSGALADNDDCWENTQVDANGTVECGDYPCDPASTACDQAEWTNANNTDIRFCYCGPWPDQNSDPESDPTERGKCFAFGQITSTGDKTRLCPNDDECAGENTCDPENPEDTWQKCKCYEPTQGGL